MIYFQPSGLQLVSSRLVDNVLCALHAKMFVMYVVRPQIKIGWPISIPAMRYVDIRAAYIP